jgi:hypothetical protein
VTPTTPGSPTVDSKDPLALRPMTRGTQAFWMVAFFALGSALAWFVVANPFDVAFLPQRTTVAESEREVLYWYAPMDPTYIRDEPGLSPMGMKLVPKYADVESGSEEGVIRIDPVLV